MVFCRSFFVFWFVGGLLIGEKGKKLGSVGEDGKKERKKAKKGKNGGVLDG